MAFVTEALQVRAIVRRAAQLERDHVIYFAGCRRFAVTQAHATQWLFGNDQSTKILPALAIVHASTCGCSYSRCWPLLAVLVTAAAPSDELATAWEGAWCW